VQMLVEEFGALENCPNKIEAKILEKDSATMTEDLRDKLRYLRHLSVASSFEVAELDIKTLVSKETYEKFRAQIDQRRRNRKKKLRDENRREQKIHADEQRLMGFPGSMVRVESEMVRERKISEEIDFPAVDGTFDVGEGAAGGAEDNNDAKFSFANIAKAKKAAAPSPMPKSSSSPVGWVSLGSVKARPATASSEQEALSEPEPEGYIPPPQRHSLGDTLAAALQRVDASQPASVGLKKKGRKGKQILLTGGPPRPLL